VGVGLGISACYFSNAYIYPNYVSWRFENELKKQPLFEMIAKNNPQQFAAFMKKVNGALQDKQSNAQIALYSAEFVNSIFYQQLVHASDDYIVLYLKATLDLYHYLNGIDPRAVVKLENGSNAIDFDLNALWDQDKGFRGLLAHLLDTKRYLIEAGMKTPVEKQDADKAEALLKGVLTDLVSKYGEEVVRGSFSPTATMLPPNLCAQVIIEFYAKILGTGNENAGIIMRHIAYLKTHPSEKHPAVTNEPTPQKQAAPPSDETQKK
jgi:hypothetical protein